MIKVDDLIEWAKRIAIGRSTSYPNGWIDATALKKLAEQVEQNEPLPYKPTVDTLYAELHPEQEKKHGRTEISCCGK